MPNTDKNRDGGHSHAQKSNKDKNQPLDAQQKNASRDAGNDGKGKAGKAPQEDMGALGFKTGD